MDLQNDDGLGIKVSNLTTPTYMAIKIYKAFF